MRNKSRFALFFGNRGFFPASLIAEAREEMAREVQALGHDALMLDSQATRYGAVETPEEGEVYANFLQASRGRYDGVIVSLPNFGDETGAVAALRQADAPIWIQAYPDDFDRMGPALRRDSFCGKISITDVFRQYGIKSTSLKPHTVRPGTDRFKANLDEFDRICRVVKGVRGMVVGAIGARTTPFKTVKGARPGTKIFVYGYLRSHPERVTNSSFFPFASPIVRTIALSKAVISTRRLVGLTPM